MKTLTFFAAAALLAVASQAEAQNHRGDRGTRNDGHRYDGHRNNDGHRSPSHRSPGWNRGHFPRYGYSGARYWHRPSYWGRSYYPYSRSHYYWSGFPGWVYAPAIPAFAYFYDWEPPVYVERVVERAPVLVERTIEREPVYVERPEQPRERSYAKVDPQPMQPRAPAIERMTLSATELFDFDKATLKLPQPRLDEIADAMKRNASIDKVHILGYTDRIGTDEYNLRLSKQRAEAVKAYLVKQGVAAHRLVAVGKGEAEPVVQCSQKNQAELIKCLEPNRRVVVEQITVEKRVVNK